MILVHCFTNLDLFREEWPSELPAMPHVGEYIESKTTHGSFVLKLKIVAITWQYHENSDEYIPLIELHDYRGGSIREFYEWYAPLVGQNASYFI